MRLVSIQEDREWNRRKREGDRKWGCVYRSLSAHHLPNTAASNTSYFRTKHLVHHSPSLVILSLTPSWLAAARSKAASRKTMTQMILMKMMIVVIMMTMMTCCWCLHLVMWSHPKTRLISPSLCLQKVRHWEIALCQTAASDSTCKWKHWVSSVCTCECVRASVCVWALLDSVRACAFYRPPAVTQSAERKLWQETSVQTYAQCATRHTYRHGGVHAHTCNWLSLHLP